MSAAGTRRAPHTKETVHAALWPTLAEEFLSVKAAQGRAARTLADYREHLAAFVRAHPEAARAEELRPALLAYVQERATLAPATYNLDFEYLRAFVRWLLDERHLREDPMRGLHKRRDEGRARALDEGLLGRLLALPDTRSYVGLRDRAMLLLTLDTGIRPGEALGLVPTDVDFATRTVLVPAGEAKTRRPRTLPLSPATLAVLRRLLAARPAWFGADAPLLASESGGRLNRNTWNGRICDYARRLGADFTPYDLRHSFALLYLRQGGNALALQRLLGHRDLTMTKRYVALAESDLRAAHETASPLLRLLPQGRAPRGSRAPRGRRP
jgi:integrase/recombinase XerC